MTHQYLPCARSVPLLTTQHNWVTHHNGYDSCSSCNLACKLLQVLYGVLGGCETISDNSWWMASPKDGNKQSNWAQVLHSCCFGTEKWWSTGPAGYNFYCSALVLNWKQQINKQLVDWQPCETQNNHLSPFSAAENVKHRPCIMFWWASSCWAGSMAMSTCLEPYNWVPCNFHGQCKVLTSSFYCLKHDWK